MRDAEFGGVLRPKRGEMDVLTDLPSPVHFDGFAFQFGQFQLDGRARVGGGYLELELEFVFGEAVGVGADPTPPHSVLARLQLEPIVVAGLVELDVVNDGLQLLSEAVLPFLILGPRVDCQQRNAVRGLFDRGYHFIINSRHVEQSWAGK